MLDKPKFYQESFVPVDEWPAELRADLERNGMNPCVGTRLVSETDTVRVWLLDLEPGRSIHFHRHVLNYFWTVVSAGRGRQYYEDGRVVELDYALGDTRHLAFGKGEHMLHNAMNVGDTVLRFTTVEFLDSPNKPLPLPARVAR